MSAAARAYFDGATNYRIFAHRALRAGNSEQFRVYMGDARRCLYYVRNSQ